MAEVAAVTRMTGSARASTGTQIDASVTPHENAAMNVTAINAKLIFLIAAPPGEFMRYRCS